MFEKYLIKNCAPTLASLKTGSLFNCALCGKCELKENLSEWGGVLYSSGIRFFVLKEDEKSALVYVYRAGALGKILEDARVRSFLKKCGYTDFSTEAVLKKLKERFSHGGDFPHEIGIFLGYPLGDVIGFIQNSGKNCKCTGCWKVYCDECSAKKTFDKIKKCTEVYTRLWSQGRTVLQLTVAA